MHARTGFHHCRPAALRKLVAAVLAAAPLCSSVCGAAEPAAQGLQPAIDHLQATLDAGRFAEVLPTGRRLSRGLPDDATANGRARVYALMFEGARRHRDLRGGNAFAADLQKDDRRRYGAGSVERVPGLFAAAKWFAWADLPERERAVLGDAVSLLERAHGSDDSRLAWPLRTIASSCVSSLSEPELARASLDRALKLDFADGREAVLERAEIFATRGDVEAVFAGPAAGTSWYRAAWQRLADSKLAGPEVANAAFAEPRPIYVRVPDEPFRSRKGDVDHFVSGTVSFSFTVSAEGVIQELRLRRSMAPIDSLPAPVTEAFREARYRPRLVAGRPVATPDHGFELRFSRDTRRSPRRVRVGQVEQVR